jgi:hypothetical protein
MRLPRMTIRRWMVTVFFFAAIITVGRLAWRSRKFQQLAAWHNLRAGVYTAAITVPPPPPAEKNFVESAVEDGLRQIEETRNSWNYFAIEDRGIGEVREYWGQAAVHTVEDLRREEEILKRAQERLKRLLASDYELNSLRRRLAAYHNDMRGKYRRAASRPWLLVAPDPPVPEL